MVNMLNTRSLPSRRRGTITYGRTAPLHFLSPWHRGRLQEPSILSFHQIRSTTYDPGLITGLPEDEGLRWVPIELGRDLVYSHTVVYRSIDAISEVTVKTCRRPSTVYYSSTREDYQQQHQHAGLSHTYGTVTIHRRRWAPSLLRYTEPAASPTSLIARRAAYQKDSSSVSRSSSLAPNPVIPSCRSRVDAGSISKLAGVPQWLSSHLVPVIRGRCRSGSGCLPGTVSDVWLSSMILKQPPPLPRLTLEASEP